MIKNITQFLNKIWPIRPQWAGRASAEASPVLRPLRGSSFFFRAASSTAALSLLHRMPRFVGAAAAAPLELLKANGPIMWHICLNRSLFTWFQEHWNIQEWGEGGFIHSMFSQIPYTVFPHIISAETIHFWIWKL